MRALAPALVMAVALVAGCADAATVAVREADRLYREQAWERAARAYATLPDSAGDWRGYGAWRAGVIHRDPLGDRKRARVQFTICAREFAAEEWGYTCLVELGDLARDSADPRAAIAAYRAALESRPRGQWSEHCLFESGRAYQELGEHAEARTEWSELLARFGRGTRAPEVQLAIARSFDLSRQPKEARRAFQNVHRTHPQHSVAPLALFGEAEALEQLGELDAALPIYLRVRQRHPNPRIVDQKIEAIRIRQERRDVDAGLRAMQDAGDGGGL